MKTRRFPPLNSLRAFEAAARRGNFARAADELSVTAAAVSHRIKDLEAALAVSLFERQARGVRLTEAGQRYHERIASAFDQIERATVQVAEAPVDGPLTVSMPQSFAQAWFAPRVVSVERRLPGLELKVEGDSRLADLRRGTVDVGLRYGSGVYAGLSSEPMLGDAVTVLGAPALLQRHAGLPLQTLLGQVRLLDDSGIGLGETWSGWTPWLREAGVGPRHALRRSVLSDSAMVVAACRAAAGLCVARVSVAFEAVRQGDLQALLPWRSTEFAYHLVTRPADEGNPRLLAFRAWLLDEIEDFARDVRQHLGVQLARPAERALGTLSSGAGDLPSKG